MKTPDEHIQQQIESYLNQEMTDLERAKFEKQIHESQDLHDEVEMQEAALEAIKRERMLALKSGLSQVNISLWSTGLIEMAKVAAISVGIISGGFGAYWLIEKDQNDNSINQKESAITIVQKNENQGKAEASPENSLPINQEPQGTESSKINPNSKTIPLAISNAPQLSTPHRKKSSGEEVKLADNSNNAEPIEPVAKGALPYTGKDINNPSDGISNRTSLESVHPEVIIKKDNKNIFHYQFSEGKLILYADFNDHLYEVIELNQNGGKQIFFCYNNAFYPLNPGQHEIAPLIEVKEKSLIQLLSAYQKRKN